MNIAPFKTDWQVMNYKIYIEMGMTQKEWYTALSV